MGHYIHRIYIVYVICYIFYHKYINKYVTYCKIGLTAWPRMELINIWNAGFILCRQRKLIGCKTLHSLCKKCCSKYCDGTTIIICQVGSKHSNFVVTEYISRRVGRVCFEWEKCWCQLIWSKVSPEVPQTRATDYQK